MQISVYHTPKEILVQSVSLKKNSLDPLNTYIFHCPYCRKDINQIQGEVSKLSPGIMPTASVIVIDQCKDCGMRFSFTSSVATNDKTEITLTSYQNRSNLFSCYISRTPLLRFNEHQIMLLTSIDPMSLPFEIACSSPTCKAHYKIVDLV